MDYSAVPNNSNIVPPAFHVVLVPGVQTMPPLPGAKKTKYPVTLINTNTINEEGQTIMNLFLKQAALKGGYSESLAYGKKSIFLSTMFDTAFQREGFLNK